MLQSFEIDDTSPFPCCFFKQFFLQNMYYLNDSIDLWNCCNQARFLNKEIIMECTVIKIFAWKFLQLPIQKI